jgi:hypothetical protein
VDQVVLVVAVVEMILVDHIQEDLLFQVKDLLVVLVFLQELMVVEAVAVTSVAAQVLAACITQAANQLRQIKQSPSAQVAQLPRMVIILKLVHSLRRLLAVRKHQTVVQVVAVAFQAQQVRAQVDKVTRAARAVRATRQEVAVVQVRQGMQV